MRTLFHWWRRRGMLPQTEKIDRLRELMKDVKACPIARHAEPVSVRKRALQLARKVS